jgi:hypothetical protein
MKRLKGSYLSSYRYAKQEHLTLYSHSLPGPDDITRRELSTASCPGSPKSGSLSVVISGYLSAGAINERMTSLV